MGIQNFMHDIVPFRIGSKVKVSPNYKFAGDWPGTYIVVGLEWKYQRGDGLINISIASDEEIEHGHGSTDGWTVDDLLPA